MKFKDLTGQRFDKFVVVSLDRKVVTDSRTNYYWNCVCDCGNEFVRERSAIVDKRSKNKSCGCYSENRLRKMRTRHGMTETRFYNIYSHMKARVLNKNNAKYGNYGGRDINISERWKEDFLYFKEDMYDSYLKHCAIHGEKDTTLERIDVNGDYTKENCTWKTIQEQENNKVIHSRVFEVVDLKTSDVIMTGNNRKKVAELLGISDTHIGSVLNGNRKSTYGYFFKYIDEK